MTRARCKHENVASLRLLQPLPIPDQAWQYISMDFIESLPKFSGKDTILVVVCRFTKYGHFIPLNHPFTASTVAKLFMHHVFKLHGAPESIILDWDKVFSSLFWKDHFKCIGTTLSFNTAYHPQTDEHSERLDRCLEAYLRSMCHLQPSTWSKRICLAEWWYKATFQSSIKMSPFKALYGYSPSFLPLLPKSLPIVGSVEDLLLQSSSSLTP